MYRLAVLYCIVGIIMSMVCLLCQSLLKTEFSNLGHTTFSWFVLLQEHFNILYACVHVCVCVCVNSANSQYLYKYIALIFWITLTWELTCQLNDEKIIPYIREYYSHIFLEFSEEKLGCVHYLKQGWYCSASKQIPSRVKG